MMFSNYRRRKHRENGNKIPRPIAKDVNKKASNKKHNMDFFLKKKRNKEKQLHYVNGVIEYAPTVTATTVDCLN
jgi:hypothetical protein